MNNPSLYLKCLCCVIAGLVLWGPVSGQHVASGQHQIFEIQQSFARGEIGVNEAVLKQFKILDESKNGAKILKCATPALMFFEAHKAELSALTKAEIASYQTSVSANKVLRDEESYISPSGKFEIFYTTSGRDSVSVTDEDNNGVPDYIDWVAEAADSSYRHEVETIGFTDPIPEGSIYRVYVEDTGGSYGYAETRNTGASNPGTVIFIENDFEGFPTNSHPESVQKGAIFVTMAHEFKHAIQYKQNRWRSPSGAFDWSEMDATLMEEVVYDDVNDYYNYIKNGFNSSDPYFESIFYSPEDGTPNAYWHVSWMIYYSERYGNSIWRDVWERIEAQNTLSIDNALRQVLPDYSDSFEYSFVRNHLWHLASGNKSTEDDYGFKEKNFYPNSNLEGSYTGIISKDSVNSIPRLAARYFEVTPDGSEEGYVDVAVDIDSTQVGIGLLFYKKDGSTRELITSGGNEPRVYLPTDIRWDEIEKFGLVLANYSNSRSTRKMALSIGSSDQKVDISDPGFADLPKEIKLQQNYPNPFNPVTNINFELPQTAEIKLEVFDMMGRKIGTLAEGTYQGGTHSVAFDGSNLASGTYLYRLQINELSITKKMMLVK